MDTPRVELYLAKISGEDVVLPEPVTRIEQLLFQWATGGRPGDSAPIVGTGKVGSMII